MILNIRGEINRYYVQSLCMVFFPGATFGENETSESGVPEVTVSVSETEDGTVLAEVSIKLNDKVCSASATVLPSEVTVISSRSSVAVGRAMFSAGKSLLGHTPPWGILTGIRPAKIAGDILLQTKSVLKTKKILRDEYFLNPQKAALAVSVATSEAKLLKKLKDNSCSLYISIPFCPSRCSYCSFVSYTTPKLLSLIDQYIDALIFDIADTVRTINTLGLTISTIYIGGGTPTTLNAEQLDKLLSFISGVINVWELNEFTLEAGRPDTITEEKMNIAKKYGVTRVSVNPQTLNDSVLYEIGRKHSSEDFFKAYDIAISKDFKDINVDLIAGLPGDDFESFSSTLDRVIALKPSNLTVHTFCVKKASDALKNNSSVYSLSGGDAAKCISYSQINAKFASYKPYYMYRQKNTVGNLENVGFSLDGHEGLYNVLMMEEVQTIFGVGAGAVTKLVGFKNGEKVIKRIFREKYPYEYLNVFEQRVKGIIPEKDSVHSQTIEFFASDN